MSRWGLIVTVLVAVGVISSALAIPVLGAVPGTADQLDGIGTSDATSTPVAGQTVDLGPVGSTSSAALSQEAEDAVEAGVDDGIELVQRQGVEVTQEQRAAAIEGALESASQHQEADVEQVQNATMGAVHGSLIQGQEANVSQVQAAVGGSIDGALAQYQTANVTQLQSAAWGASHGAIAQEQTATVEQIQVATRGAAAGAASEAGEKDVGDVGKIQEAAQGAAYGVLEQYQKITVEQRQQVTVAHVQYAAAGAAGGALEGSVDVEELEQRVEFEQEQRVEIEQRQQVTIKQVQRAAMGAAKGALDQKQTVTVEQTQAAAWGAAKGSLVQVQQIDVTQIQRVSITQIQEASFGAAKGSITQSQEATVEQIQAAADGAAGGALVQSQEVTVTQVQGSAFGSAKGAVESAVQQQIVEVEQIQAASYGASLGAVTQVQIVNVVQVQVLAQGAASGALEGSQEATVTQIQTAAFAACQETATVIGIQRVSITQLQVIVQGTAADTTAYAVQEGIDDETELRQFVELEVSQRLEAVDELEGEATLSMADQGSDGETVFVDAATLSEGGFVALYADNTLEFEDILGVSGYLEPGEYENLEIALDEPLEAGGELYAVAHLDTTGDETFAYVESEGDEDVPYATGDGAPVLDAAVVTLEETPEAPPEATLSVDDQEGDGETLVVDAATASVEYALTVTDADDEQLAESEPFDADEPLDDETLTLEAPLEADATLEVAVVAADGQELASEGISYSVVEEPTASVSFEDQESDGTNVTVDAATLSDGGFVAIHDEAALEEASPETVLGVSSYLEPGEYEDIEVAFGEDGETDALEDGESTLVAVAHQETTDDETFAYVETDGEEDGPYVDEEGDPVVDEAAVTVELEPPADAEVEFLSCSAVEITGEVEGVRYTEEFYATEGFGNVISTPELPWEEFSTETTILQLGSENDTDERDDGTRIVQVAENGAYTGTTEDRTSVLRAVELLEDDGSYGPSIENPDGAACLEAVRPLLPELSVVAAEPSDDGTAIDVTFGSENPNENEILAPGAFVEGETDDEPPAALEPGETEFTVEWTPDDDEEQLVWEIDLSAHGYEEPISVATAPAGAFGEPPDALEEEPTEPEATPEEPLEEPPEAVEEPPEGPSEELPVEPPDVPPVEPPGLPPADPPEQPPDDPDEPPAEPPDEDEAPEEPEEGEEAEESDEDEETEGSDEDEAVVESDAAEGTEESE